MKFVWAVLIIPQSFNPFFPSYVYLITVSCYHIFLCVTNVSNADTCYLLSVSLDYNVIFYLKGKGCLTVLEKVRESEATLTLWVSTSTQMFKLRNRAFYVPFYVCVYTVDCYLRFCINLYDL
jgi:hypothetical protein